MLVAKPEAEILHKCYGTKYTPLVISFTCK